jgi:phage FluMu protein Com
MAGRKGAVMAAKTNGAKPAAEAAHRAPRMRDYRCPHCGRLLFRAKIEPGTVVDIRCTRGTCHAMLRIDETWFARLAAARKAVEAAMQGVNDDLQHSQN